MLPGVFTRCANDGQLESVRSSVVHLLRSPDGPRWLAHGVRVGLRIARAATVRLLEVAARPMGFTLVTRHFWGPVPNVRRLPASVWARRSSLSGIHFAPSEQLGYVQRELERFIGEFQPAADESAAGAFYLDNNTYGSVDAELLYAMVRRHRPRRVVELGSGASSLVIASALERNAQQGNPGNHVVFDPYPASVAAVSETVLRAVACVNELEATDVPLQEFRTLHCGDILFVDTTHTVKTAGDVNFVVLDVLPLLAPGVIVHFHDVFLPWEYPRDWAERFWCYWAEQYLLQAFLAFNDEYQVLCSAQALIRDHPDEIEKLIPSFAARRETLLAPIPWPKAPDGHDSAFVLGLATLARRLREPIRPSVTPGALWLRRVGRRKTP